MVERQPVYQVEGFMQTVQEELQILPETAEDERRDFQHGLWLLHTGTKMLPPLPDLSGEVAKIGEDPVAMGGFSDVYLGRWLGEEPVALKVMRGIQYTQSIQKRFASEVKIWRSLQHKNVARMYGVAWMGNNIYMVSPWMENRDLLYYLKHHAQADRIKLLWETALGLGYLHSHKPIIVHGDLRAANILISETGSACISDFGLSRVLEDIGDESGLTTTHDGTGSIFWQAVELMKPELIGRTTAIVTKESDVWSFGMVCIEVLTGKHPFPRKKPAQVINQVLEGHRPPRPQNEEAIGLTDELWALIQRCWRTRPSERPTMPQIASTLHSSKIKPQLQTEKLSTTKLEHEIPSRRSLVTPSAQASSSSSPVNYLPLLSPTTGSPTLDRPLRPKMEREGGFRSERQSPSVGTPRSSPTQPIVESPISPSDTSRPFIPSRQQSESRTGSTSLNEPSDFGFDSPFQTWSNYHGYSTLPSSDEPPAANAEASTPPPSNSSLPPVANNGIVNVSPAGKIISGNLKGFIERLTPNEHYKTQEDLDFRKAFLVVNRAFCVPNDIFQLLKSRYVDASGGVKWAVLNFLCDWIQRQRFETQDSELLAEVRQFAESVTGGQGSILFSNAAVISEIVNDKLRSLAISASALVASSNVSMTSEIPSVVNSATAPTAGHRVTRLQLPKIEPAKVAEQLTLHESQLFAKIDSADLVTYLKGPPGSTTLERLQRLNANISSWVQVLILQCETRAGRADAIKYFIELAERFASLCNFSAMYAVVVALDCLAIKRLKYTWEAVGGRLVKRLAEMSRMIDWDHNFSNYRKAIKDAAEQPRIPLLFVHLRDLQACHCALRRVAEVEEPDLIMWARFRHVSNCIFAIIAHQSPPYKLEEDKPQITNLLGSIRSTVANSSWEEETSRRLFEKEKKDYDLNIEGLEAAGFKPRAR